MTYQAILFDLDGTLPPMDLDNSPRYFIFLAQDGRPVWLSRRNAGSGPVEGCGAMVKNQGKLLQLQRFGDPPRCWGLRCMTTFNFDAFMRQVSEGPVLTGPNPETSQAVGIGPEEGRAGDSGHESLCSHRQASGPG